MLPQLEDLFVISADFRRAPLEFRELLVGGFEVGQRPETLLTAEPGIRDALWLMTCDRVEAVILAEAEQAATEAVQRVLWRSCGIDVSGYWERFFVHRASGAFRHLTRIACGLDLAYPGSRYGFREIERELARGQTAPVRTSLHSLLEEVRATALALEAEAAQKSPADPVIQAVLAMLSRYFGPLAHRSGMVIGSGLLAGELSRRLMQEDVHLRLTGLLEKETESLAGQLEMEATPLTSLQEASTHLDFVVAVTRDERPHRIPLEIGTAETELQWHPLLAIDLSFPRILRALPGAGVFLYDTDQVSRYWREKESPALLEREALVTAGLASLFRAPFAVLSRYGPFPRP